VITLLALEAGLAPPTAGLVEPEAPELRHVMGRALPLELESAISSSFGFGGMGSVLVFERADAENRLVRTRERSSLVFTSAAEIEGDALPELDPERSRRFDRGAAATALAAERALRGAGLAEREVGLVVGSAFGNVERSIRFLQRVAERGPKLANPAEFPHLVASAAAGNASVYAGFRGPVLTATEHELAAESALSRALALFELSDVDAVVTGAVAARDVIVDQVLGVQPGDTLPRGEGAAFATLERETVARSRRGRALGRLLRHREIRSELVRALAEEGIPGPASALILGGTTRDLRSTLEASAWGSARRIDLLRELGRHEALGAFAIARALAAFAKGELRDALIVSGSTELCYLTRLEAATGGEA
jgi:hypothetical protein